MMKDGEGIILLSDTGNDCISVFKQSDENIIRKTEINMSAESGPHGITVCKSGQFVFFTNSYDRSMGILDLESGKVTDCIGTGTTPCHIIESGKKLYVTNLDSDSISVVDLEEKSGVAVVSSGIMPHDGIAVDGKIVITESGSESLGIIDDREDTYEERTQLGCSPAHIIRMKCINGEEILVAACTDFGIEVKGYLCIIDLKTMKANEKIRIGHCITDIAADSDGIHIYVADGGTGSIYKIDIITGLVMKNLYISGFPSSIIMNKNRKHILVTESLNGRVFVIDKDSFEILSRINAGKDAAHIVEL